MHKVTIDVHKLNVQDGLSEVETLLDCEIKQTQDNHRVECISLYGDESTSLIEADLLSAIAGGVDYR